MRMCTCVSSQFTTHTHIPFASFQIVNGANVIQATTGHIVARRGICTGHDPRGTQRDGMDLNERTQTKQTYSSSNLLISDTDFISSPQLPLHRRDKAQ